MKSKRSKATDITIKVKHIVWERDKEQCILCHSKYAFPNAHYISRSHGGLGIEENVVTLCRQCHHLFDNSKHRQKMKQEIRQYLISKYPNWDETKLKYTKEIGNV